MSKDWTGASLTTGIRAITRRTLRRDTLRKAKIVTDKGLELIRNERQILGIKVDFSGGHLPLPEDDDLAGRNLTAGSTALGETHTVGRALHQVDAGADRGGQRAAHIAAFEGHPSFHCA